MLAVVHQDLNQGMILLFEALYHLQERVERTQVVALKSEQDVSRWERLDDVIMGGQSESGVKQQADGTAVWEGVLRVEGGGFCGTRIKVCLLVFLTLWNLQGSINLYLCLAVLPFLDRSVGGRPH